LTERFRLEMKKALKEKKFCGREQMWVHI
jgi:hypothetical protein